MGLQKLQVKTAVREEWNPFSLGLLVCVCVGERERGWEPVSELQRKRVTTCAKQSLILPAVLRVNIDNNVRWARALFKFALDSIRAPSGSPSPPSRAKQHGPRRSPVLHAAARPEQNIVFNYACLAPPISLNNGLLLELSIPRPARAVCGLE